MRWQEGRESENVEDRRPVRRSAWPWAAWARSSLSSSRSCWARIRWPCSSRCRTTPRPGAQAPVQDGPEEARKVAFVKHVLAETEDVWDDLFRRLGKQYRQPKLMLFTGKVDSACGLADSAVGPFYCPGDEKVYIDLQFYDELKQRFHAPGDFANAYVIAHEVGHHVQNLMGVSIEAKHRQLPNDSRNQLSVRLEAPSRLSCRHLGLLGQPEDEDPGAGRRRERHHRRHGHRRRQAAKDGTRLRRARELHARHVPAAGQVVPRGAEVWEAERSQSAFQAALPGAVIRYRREEKVPDSGSDG